MSKQYNITQKRRDTSRLRRCIGYALMALLLTTSAQAQLKLPGLSVPSTSTIQSSPITDKAADTLSRLDNIAVNTASELDSRSEQLLRAARVRALLRANPTLLETDPNGAPVMRGQVVSLSPSSQSLQTAIDAGFVVVKDERINDLDIRFITLQAPKGMTVRRALQRLRALDRNGKYDYNHVYTQSAIGTLSSATSQTNNSIAGSTEIYPHIHIGLIDGGVDTTHPVFRTNTFHYWGCDQQLAASAHGTAVASLLVGHSEEFDGAAPGAELYTADVYCGQAVGGAVTRIAGAIAWLAQQQIPVINISLVGPDNIVLRSLITRLVTRGHLIVAAVGNDGPSAPALYPASYPGVIGVTAVDAHNHVLVEAGRGRQVMFAAPGAEITAATLQGQMINVRGTSFAAPIVAGLLATYIDKPSSDAAKVAIDMLVHQARDLGPIGYDTTYGYGVVGESLRVTKK